MEEKIKKKVNKTKIVVDVLNLMIVILFIFLAIFAVYNRKSLEISTLNEIQHYGYFALFIFNFVLEFIPQLITPIFTYIPVILLEMNIYLAILIVVLGSFLGSLAGFLFGKKFGSNAAENIIGFNKYRKIVYYMDMYGKIAVFIAAITPLPYVPMIIGSLRLSNKNFIIFGLIPRAIGLMLFGCLFYLGFISF